MADKKQRRLFIIVRGRLLDDKENMQLVQFIVPGFNMVMNFECPVGTSDEEISDKQAEFLLKANGYLADWEQALASGDADVEAKYPDKGTYEVCWLVNLAVESSIKQVAGDKDVIDD